MNELVCWKKRRFLLLEWQNKKCMIESQIKLFECWILWAFLECHFDNSLYLTLPYLFLLSTWPLVCYESFRFQLCQSLILKALAILEYRKGKERRRRGLKENFSWVSQRRVSCFWRCMYVCVRIEKVRGTPCLAGEYTFQSMALIYIRMKLVPSVTPRGPPSAFFSLVLFFSPTFHLSSAASLYRVQARASFSAYFFHYVLLLSSFFFISAYCQFAVCSHKHWEYEREREHPLVTYPLEWCVQICVSPLLAYF